jgi:hypothetical protein
VAREQRADLGLESAIAGARLGEVLVETVARLLERRLEDLADPAPALAAARAVAHGRRPGRSVARVLTGPSLAARGTATRARPSSRA